MCFVFKISFRTPEGIFELCLSLSRKIIGAKIPRIKIRCIADHVETNVFT